MSWNDNAPQAHKDLMEELELNTTVNSSSNTYGENMMLAGQAGSTYATFTNALEAIMWHGNPQSDARYSVEKFRALDKKDRDAVVKFIEAI